MSVPTATGFFTTRNLKDYREDPQKVLPFYGNSRHEGFILLYIDGASRGNPGEAGIGIVIKGSDGQIIEEISKYIGVTTNNRAEYTALIEGLKEVKRLKRVHGSRTSASSVEPFAVHGLMILTDSELLVRQLKGQYKVRDKNLKELYNKVSFLLSDFEPVGARQRLAPTGLGIDIRHISREYNKEADKLANKAIDTKEKGIRGRPDDRSPK